ncbi:hypothetical protein [Sphingomonas fuzhouensis]|uniref:hypothetical protein n=1 Tax=Sphingomonas fuzhouensis TaxID=3106033 RepID=UPI002AFED5BC|nr:hypothetical protein [Sphingomonas sp. SGZ-02]
MSQPLSSYNIYIEEAILNVEVKMQVFKALIGNQFHTSEVYVAATDKEKACAAIERHLLSESWQAIQRRELEWSDQLEDSRKATAEDHRYELMRDSVEAETEPAEADELKTHSFYGPLLQDPESVNTSSGQTWANG